MIFLKTKRQVKTLCRTCTLGMYEMMGSNFSPLLEREDLQFATLLSRQYFKNRDITSFSAPIILKQKVNGFGEREALSYLSVSILLLQVDIPNIQKQRKHLAKLVLDMDSARTR